MKRHTLNLILSIGLFLVALSTLSRPFLDQSLAAEPDFKVYLPTIIKADNSLIAYTSPYTTTIGTNYYSLLIMDPNGNQVATLYENEFTSLTGKDWSPDKTQLVFSGRIEPEGEYAIYLTDIEGTNLTHLVDTDYQSTTISWSPDGQKIVFDNGTNIFTMNADGTNLMQLTEENGNNESADWSPNGQQIVFSSDRHGKSGIYIMNADGSNQTLIGNNSYDNFSPSWSPDGTQIAFSQATSILSVWDLMIMNTDGTSEQLVYTPPSSFIGPCIFGVNWSPNGKELLYSEHHSTRILFPPRLVKIKIDTAESTYLTRGDNPSWSQ